MGYLRQMYSYCSTTLDTFVTDDGVINITAQGFAGDPLLILLADNGATGSGSLPTVEVENLRTEKLKMSPWLRIQTFPGNLLSLCRLQPVVKQVQAMMACSMYGQMTLFVLPMSMLFDGTNSNVM